MSASTPTWTVSRSLPTLDATRELAEALARSLPRDPFRGAFVGLVGDLGAGKTAFVQAFVAALPGGAGLSVTSPTYTVLERYDTEPPTHHLDLYRLTGVQELEAIGHRDLYYGCELTVVEWVDHIPEAIPKEWLELRLTRRADDARQVELRAHGARYAAWLKAAGWE